MNEWLVPGSPDLSQSLPLSFLSLSRSLAKPVQPHPPPPAPSHFLHTFSSVLPKPLHHLPPSNFTLQLSSISQPRSDSSQNNIINNNTGMCRSSHSLIWISASKLSLSCWMLWPVVSTFSPRDSNCEFRIICKHTGNRGTPHSLFWLVYVFLWVNCQAFLSGNDVE